MLLTGFKSLELNQFNHWKLNFFYLLYDQSKTIFPQINVSINFQLIDNLIGRDIARKINYKLPKGSNYLLASLALSHLVEPEFSKSYSLLHLASSYNVFI